jgi:hypothetical protein
MAAAHAAQQTQQNQLADFGGKVRHWERMKVRVHAHQGFGPGGETLHLGGFNLTKWMATDTPLAQDLCEPPKGIVPVKVPFKRARSPTPDPEEQAAKLPPRRSSRLSVSMVFLSPLLFFRSKTQALGIATRSEKTITDEVGCLRRYT